MVKITSVVLHDGPKGATGPSGTNIYVQTTDPGAVPDGTLWLDSSDTGGSDTINWGNIAGTLSNQTDLNTALAAKAPLASPALTGTPTAPTAAPGTNTTQVATTAFVLANGGSSPLTTKGDLYGYSTANARVPVGSDGQVLTADSTQTPGVKWAAAPATGVPYLPTAADERQSTVGSLGSTGGSNNPTITANTLYLTPLLIRKAFTITKCNFGVQTAGTSSNVHIGLYTMNTTSPTLIADFGATSTASTGFKTISSLSVAVTQGWYLVAMLADVTFTANGFVPVFGWSRAGTDSGVYALLSVAQTYGALPASPTVTRDAGSNKSFQVSVE